MEPEAFDDNDLLFDSLLPSLENQSWDTSELGYFAEDEILGDYLDDSFSAPLTEYERDHDSRPESYAVARDR